MYRGDMQGFSLKLLKHLVLDEGDRLLNMDFEQEIDQILKAIPKVVLNTPQQRGNIHAFASAR